MAIDAKLDIVEANVLRRYYQHGLSLQTHEAAGRVFQRYFGDDAPFVAYYFHRYHLLLHRLVSLERASGKKE